MSKLENLKRAGMANAFESMGAFSVSAVDVVTMPPASPSRHDGVTRARDVCIIPVEKIGRDPGQPREEFDEEALRRLADSLKARGQLQPIGVRWDEGRGVYVIVYGERRWRAATLAGLNAVSAVVLEKTLDPEELLVVQLVENAVREDLRPVEQARAYRRLMDARGWSTRQVARELSVDQAKVVRVLALLDLPEDVQGQVDEGTISQTTAYEISKAPVAEQPELARRVVREGLRSADVAETRLGEKVRKFRREVKVPGGSVVVTLHDPEASDEEIVAALQAAIKKIRKGGSGRSVA
jgi:ParB family chromosome partitioning protein